MAKAYMFNLLHNYKSIGRLQQILKAAGCTCTQTEAQENESSFYRFLKSRDKSRGKGKQ
jgi:hypothetical protein